MLDSMQRHSWTFRQRSVSRLQHSVHATHVCRTPPCPDPANTAITRHYFFTSSSSPYWAFLFVVIRSCLLSRAALVLSRLACISSFTIRSRCFSALALWICGGRVRIRCLCACRGRNVTYVFDQPTLVLEGVTLAQVVKFMVEVLVDLA